MEVGVYVEACCSGHIHPIWRVVGAQHALVVYADPYKLCTCRKRPDGNQVVDALRAKVQSFYVFRIGRFEPMEQSSIKDVDKLVDAMDPDGEVNDLGVLGIVEINQIEIAVCLGNSIVRQSHRRE